MSGSYPLIIRLRALSYTLMICRFNLFILLAGTVLLFVAQGQDLLVELVDGEATDWVASLSLLGGVTLWAFSIWYWARVLLDIRFPDPPVPYGALRFWFKHLPRVLGLVAFLGVIGNLLRAVGPVWEAWALGVLAVVYYLAVLFRRDIAQWLARKLRAEDPESHWIWADSIDTKTEPAMVSWRDAWRSHWVKAMLVAGVVMLVWGLAAPLSMSHTFNTPLLLFVWGATFLPLGSAITYAGNRSGVPVYGLLILLAVAFSFFNDNHTIRPLVDTHTAPPQRPTLDGAVDAWIKANCQDSACPPFVIVATAGGGIRAAYWTGTVLGTLHERSAVFPERLFAISGVSGGSVGATMYRAALASGVPAGKMKAELQQALGQDYLTPVSAGLLYRDFVQRFLPGDVFGDRAKVFEQGLETGFQDATGKDTLAQTGFAALTAGDRQHPWPALFLNSTWSDNGRRIVAAGLDMTGHEVIFSDLLDRLGYDMRLSTAAHNSARFPLVSPPGSWTMTFHDPSLIEQLGSDRMLQRLQDGGLFENYGAETAREILLAARQRFHDREAHPERPYFDPLVILISSDPGLPDDLAVPDLREPSNVGYELLTTFRTYAATRVGRGAEAAAALKTWIRESDRATRYAHLRMCGADQHADPPLGWALSGKAQSDIQGFLPNTEPDEPCRHDNWQRVANLVATLNGPPRSH